MNMSRPSINRPTRRKAKCVRRCLTQRQWLLAGMIGSCVLIGVSAVHHLAPVLIWNGSASAPLGAYVRVRGTLKQGDLVLSDVPDFAQQIIDQRGYLPSGIPVLKRIAALQDDIVCRTGAQIYINGQLRTVARARDRQKRPMPVWRGCKRLRATEVFLLLENPLSFDGRYFGVTSTKLIIGRYRPLWTYERRA
jgi:conjugative transfer signal peptidase TraF